MHCTYDRELLHLISKECFTVIWSRKVLQGCYTEYIFVYLRCETSEHVRCQ